MLLSLGRLIQGVLDLEVSIGQLLKSRLLITGTLNLHLSLGRVLSIDLNALGLIPVFTARVGNMEIIVSLLLVLGPVRFVAVVLGRFPSQFLYLPASKL